MWRAGLCLGFLSLAMCFSGCSALKKGLIRPELNAVKAEQDANAIKVAGDVVPIKGALTAEVQPMVGANSIERTTVGGNQTVTNDSEIIKEYMKRDAEKSSELVNLYRFIVGGLLMLIGNYELANRKLNNRLLDARDKDDEREEARLDKALDKKEA